MDISAEELQEMRERAREVSPLLDAVLIHHPKDYDPWGEDVRWADPNRPYPDCSGGCKWAIPLEDLLGADWVVCANPKSHRAGLLTFEHQGCPQWEMDETDEEEGEAEV